MSPLRPASRSPASMQGFAGAGLILALMFSAGACKKQPEPPVPPEQVEKKAPTPPAAELWPAVVIRNDRGEDWLIRVELARTPDQLTRGLMERGPLEPDTGMLFIFPDSRVRSFWMKNTWIPLDMIFIGKDRRIVGIVENAEPNTETSRSVGRPSRWVLEVSGGAAGARGLKTGDRVYFYVDAALKE